MIKTDNQSHSASAEIFLFLVNGTIATAVHFLILSIEMEILLVSSAALANLVAAFFGVFVSFLGNRYIVFRAQSGNLISQISKSASLYITIVLMHVIFLFVWTDISGLKYQFGFIIAVGIQAAFSYFANKYLVFVK